ncbi:MAG TPA: tetratricopeptide repeat protein [Mucilaginibacter sp.]|jgi:signal transduction histidine kinase|nr:tetratricopeptide repeat protein [Mucilaginibacter sp.]
MRKLAIVLLFTTIFTNSFAQQKEIDSLKKLVATAKDDTSKVMQMRVLSRLYLNSKPDTALSIAQEMLRISTSVQFIKGEAMAINTQGLVYMNAGNYPKALNYLLSALKLAEQAGDQSQQIRINSNIGNIFYYQGDYRATIENAKRNIEIAKKLNEKRTIETQTGNIGDCYEKLNMLDSALIYTRRATPLAKELKDIDLIGTNVNNLGNIYSKMHMPDTALHYYRQALPYWKQAEDDDGLCETTLGMAKIFRQLGKQDSSLYYARQSIAAGWRGGFTPRVLDASEFLTAYFKQRGQLDSAYRYLEVSVAAKDSLFSQEKNRELQNISFTERQRRQDIQDKEAASKTAIRYYLLLAVIVFLVVMAIVFWRNNKQNKKANTQIQRTLEELKTTQNQLVQSAKMASLGELTAGIAHEIQNPLNFVNNFSDVNREMIGELKEELKGGNISEALVIADDIEQNETKINHHGKRADFIVKGMLEHSRNSTGERQVTNINVLADEFMKLSYHGLRAKDKNFNAELVTHFDPNLPKVNIVQQDIGRVLINLFSNAFYAVNQKAKTTGPDYKPTVEVSTEKGNGSILIKVKDNGNGIPEAIKDKIMQPFFTTKPTGEGTGLGLSLSYDIVVKGHGGRIDVDTSEGEYSEFTISLPG